MQKSSIPANIDFATCDSDNALKDCAKRHAQILNDNLSEKAFVALVGDVRNCIEKNKWDFLKTLLTNILRVTK